MSSEGQPFTPSADWGATLRTDWWLMGTARGHKIRLTYFNSPSTPGTRVICAEGSWNRARTALVATVDVIRGDVSTTQLIVLDIGQHLSGSGAGHRPLPAVREN